MPKVSDLAEYEEALLPKLEALLPGYREFLADYREKVKRLDRYKRKRMSISLAAPTVEALKWFAEHIRDEDGEPIPLSYVIEDALTWIFKDPLLLLSFVTEMYAFEEVENFADEGSSAEKKVED